METLWDLSRLRPSFVSVTYGAGGSTRGDTLDLVSRIKRDLGIEAMAHLTCQGHSREQIDTILADMEAAGIENILALRGDPPQGEERFTPDPEGFTHASELTAHIRSRGDFCIGGACYPEGHTECPDLSLDMDHLQEKISAGADFLVTQLFFENTDYFSFIERARRRGISLPILPGIMPVTNLGQVQRFTDLCGATLPAELIERIQAQGDNILGVRDVGTGWAIKQCRKLLAAGAPGAHFYTLNHSSATRAVFQALT
jgi:methylenetetrahydrofolate reductase (NADPH)